jgi:hypothetical protein
LEHFRGNHSLSDHETSDKEPLIPALERTFIQVVVDLSEKTKPYLISESKGQIPK